MRQIGIAHGLRWQLGVCLVAVLVCAPQILAAPVPNKTVRVDHGRPVIVANQESVLVIEFAKEPIGDALIPHQEEDIRHCRAKYRYLLFHGATDAVTNGTGMVEEVYQTVSSGPTGRQVKDVGSRTGISAGEFHLSWSEGGAGSRSWLYYRTDSSVRFLQQPTDLAFEAIDRERLRAYLTARNVSEFVAAGRSVQVIGPAVFSGDLPTEAAVAGRIRSAQVRNDVFELELSDLATNQNYIIESSYELKSGGWMPAHSFIARQSNHKWSEPLGTNASMSLYRIRQGPY